VVVIDPTQKLLATTVEANLFGWLSNYGRAKDSVFRIGADVAWFYTGVPIPLLNGAFGAKVTERAADERIQSITREFESRAVPFAWWLGPSSEPANLPKRLRRHGFSHLGEAPGMAANLRDLVLDEPTPEFVSVRRVRTSEDLDSWSEAFARSFSLSEKESHAWREVHRRVGLDEDSPLRHYAVFSGRRPVSTASTFMEGDVVGLYHVGTVPETRRQGLGRAATIDALRDARDAGCRIAVLQTSRIGMRLYHRLGFQRTGLFDVYTHGVDREAANVASRTRTQAIAVF